MTTTTRKRLTSDERREQIIDAARRVFIGHGLAGARTRDIAAEAGVTEALVYRHFASKEELYEAAVAAPLEAAVRTLIEMSGEPPTEFDVTGDEMRERTVQFIRDLLVVMQDIAPLLGVSLFGEFNAARDYYTQRIAPTLDAVKQVVEANLLAWAHRDFDIELAVRLVFGGTWFHATAARLEQAPLDVDRYAEQVTTILLSGLFTGPELS